MACRALPTRGSAPRGSQKVPRVGWEIDDFWGFEWVFLDLNTHSVPTPWGYPRVAKALVCMNLSLYKTFFQNHLLSSSNQVQNKIVNMNNTTWNREIRWRNNFTVKYFFSDKSSAEYCFFLECLLFFRSIFHF